MEYGLHVGVHVGLHVGVDGYGVNTYRYIFSGMNIPFTSYFGVH